MQWIMILIVFDHLSSGEPWMDTVVREQPTRQACIAYKTDLRKLIRTANIIICLRKLDD